MEKILGINSKEPLDFPQKFDIMDLPLVKMCKGGALMRCLKRAVLMFEEDAAVPAGLKPLMLETVQIGRASCRERVFYSV